MTKTILNLLLAVAFGSFGGCLAADNAVRPHTQPGGDVSNIRQTAGRETDKTGHTLPSTHHDMGQSNSVKSETGKSASGTSLNHSINELGKNADKATASFDNAAKAMGNQAREQIGKAERAIQSGNNNGKSVPHKGPGASSDLEKNASAAASTLGKEADQAERAITSTVRGIGKNNTESNVKGRSAAGSSFDNSMNEMGKNFNKAGAAIESSVKVMGKQAGSQMGKAEHAIESSNKGQNAKKP